ncbi:ras-domain-containing protein [Stereum hirsutum FP-91666 SS1]|uniref:ras-domain-containing protein n=1 Tax=Stereum hirsutum (strain FP-91666) TaxID=721885 RepID=UPI000440EDBC|nr:ras-domain-containing protein [Stereum hirsutum FP-91666 SS1]EIM89650.1 ras-domain-containing protein [Stereum hirsutum FP-91666 SS1]
MSGITWHYVLKFIITGDAAVGKSSLLVRLTDQRFLANPDPTLGVEFGSKLITIPEENKVVKLQCWDTAGTESFRSITRSYYRGAAGCLLVYDITSRQSFLNARTWLEDVRKHADPHLTCILVGNKSDLCPPSSSSSPSQSSSSPQTQTSSQPSSTTTPTPTTAPSRSITPTSSRRQVSVEEAQLWAQEEGLLFVEASAKNGENVEKAFEEACRDILSKIRRGVFDDERSPGVKLSKPNASASGGVALDGQAKGSCCGT